MRVIPLTLSFAFVFCMSLSSKAATLNWGAAVDRGLGDQNGNDLSAGSLLRVGTFTIDNNTIRNNSGNLSFLDASFLQFGTSTIGEGFVGANGHWSTSSSSADPQFANEPVYIWAFNSPTLGGATEHGIFTSIGGSWTYGSDGGPIPWEGTIDLSEVQEGDANQIIVGGFGVGTSDLSGGVAPLYNLTAVPEPAITAVVAGLACFIGGVLMRRRPRSDSEAGLTTAEK